MQTLSLKLKNPLLTNLIVSLIVVGGFYFILFYGPRKSHKEYENFYFLEGQFIVKKIKGHKLNTAITLDKKTYYFQSQDNAVLKDIGPGQIFIKNSYEGFFTIKDPATSDSFIVKLNKPPDDSKGIPFFN